MKQNTETISEITFTHFPSSNTRSYTKNHSGENQTSLLLSILKKQALSFKHQLLSGAATLGIGTVLLITVYLFFTQLAEYGWQ